MSDQLYYRNKDVNEAYNNWRKLILSRSYDTDFNFKHYDFKLNDIIYTRNSSEWQQEIRKQQLWMNLRK